MAWLVAAVVCWAVGAPRVRTAAEPHGASALPRCLTHLSAASSLHGSLPLLQLVILDKAAAQAATADILTQV